MCMGAVLSPPLTFDHPAIYKTSWRVGETIALVCNYAKTRTKTRVYLILCNFIVFYITLGIELETFCIRGPILTNWAMGATSLWSSCSPSCLPPVPLGKRCGQGPLTIRGNPVLQKGIPYCRR